MLINIFIIYESDCESSLLRKVHSGLFVCQEAVPRLASFRLCGNLFLNAEPPPAEVQWVIFCLCSQYTPTDCCWCCRDAQWALCAQGLVVQFCVCSEAIHLFVPAPSGGSFYQELISTIILSTHYSF